MEGLSQAQIFDALAEHGIDPSQLSGEQLTELLTALRVEQNASNVASWFGTEQGLGEE